MRVGAAAVLLAACHSTEPIPDDLVEPTDRLAQCAAAVVVEDKSVGFVLSQWIGTFLMLAVLFVILEGAYRVYSNARAGRTADA